MYILNHAMFAFMFAIIQYFFAVLTFKQPTERATKKNVPVQNVPNTPVWGPQSTCLSRLRTGQSDLSVAGFWIPTLALSSCA